MNNLMFMFKDTHFVVNYGGNEHKLIDFSQNLTSHSTVYCMKSFAELIQSYSQISGLTMATTLEQDIITLTSAMFGYLLKTSGEKIRMLEIGSFFGCSSYFAAKTLGLLKSDALLYCCDSWKGANGGIEDLSACVDTLAYFRGVMKYLGVFEQIVPLAGDSTSCLDAFRDDYFDMIFIDGGHQYETVLHDIKTAVRHIKTGGLIMGHDCECLFSQLPEKIKTKKIANSEISEDRFHTGVIFALEELFHGNYEKPVPNSLIWIKKIEKTDKNKILQPENAEWNAIRKLLESIAQKLDNMVDSKVNSFCAKEADAVGRIYACAEKKIADLKCSSAFKDIKYRIAQAYDCHLSYINALTLSKGHLSFIIIKREIVLLSQLMQNFKKKEDTKNER